MKQSTIIKIDINGFSQAAAGMDADGVADYLQQFYRCIFAEAAEHGFVVIKCMGDCVLLRSSDDADSIKVFYSAVAEKYPVTLCYRQCVFAQALINVDDYSCNDVFGEDINKLFMADAQTVTLQ